MVGRQVLHSAGMSPEEPLGIFEVRFDLNDYDGGAGNICKDPSIR